MAASVAPLCDLDLQWQQFCSASKMKNNHSSSGAYKNYTKKRVLEEEEEDVVKVVLPMEVDATVREAEQLPLLMPMCTPLYISTQTKIAYLNQAINLKQVFWQIPIVPYYLPVVGVVKKQMKFNSLNVGEIDEILAQKALCLEQDMTVDDYLISHVDVPEGRVPFKDIRKISVGLSRKDITSYRGKKKSAFYNCFVVFLRLKLEGGDDGQFKEYHVKVFNTGKLEIPGIQDEVTLNNILLLLTNTLEGIVTSNENATVPSLPLAFDPLKTYTVLINSNFSCGYYINRERFHHLLKYKYRINSNYDPCSYPGIQCEFHYDSLMQLPNGMQPTLERTANLADVVCKVSFMIFRTGSVLIVGKCTEFMLHKIYDFLCEIFTTEFANIYVLANDGQLVTPQKEKVAKKSRKVRKMTLMANTIKLEDDENI
jgi:hypothetical protein